MPKTPTLTITSITPVLPKTFDEAVDVFTRREYALKPASIAKSYNIIHLAGTKPSYYLQPEAGVIQLAREQIESEWEIPSDPIFDATNPHATQASG